MISSNFISGDKLVALGVTTTDAVLPEIGAKDIIPCHTKIEKEQIQAALQTRKQLIATERIEKSGTLSHAEWLDELNQAKVTQKAGGHWNFIGHNVGTELYMNPEEALFLIESNCLHLKHNGVTVSLQKAYSLLIGESLSTKQYKVYATLSRIGYKVFRHCNKHVSKENNNQQNNTEKNQIQDNNFNNTNNEIVSCTDHDSINDNDRHSESAVSMEIDNTESINMETDESKTTTEQVISEKQIKSDESIKESKNFVSDINVADESNCNSSTSNSSTEENLNYVSVKILQDNIKILHNRKYKPVSEQVITESFSNIGNLIYSKSVSIKVPEDTYLPKNVFVDKALYVLDLNNISRKHNKAFKRRFTEDPSSNGSSSETHASAKDLLESHGHIRPPQAKTQRLNPRFGLLGWSQWYQPPIGYCHYGVFGRQFVPHYDYPRIQMRQPHAIQHFNMPYTNTVPYHTECDQQKYHYLIIQNLATRLKQQAARGLGQLGYHIRQLKILVNTYNKRFKKNLVLVNNFDITHENVVETITLDDNNQREINQPQCNDHREKYLNKIKALAFKLKTFEKTNISARNKRGLSKAIKTFNKTFKADIYLNEKYQISDRSCIVLASSSDSDCIEDEIIVDNKMKKLRNPFNILKKLSEKSNLMSPSTSIGKDISNGNDTKQIEQQQQYREYLEKNISKYWLPNDDDFGKPELVSQQPRNAYFLNKWNENLYEYLKKETHKCNNWTDIKLSFLKCVLDEIETNILKDSLTLNIHDLRKCDDSEMSSIISPADCTDMISILKKLSVIKNNTDIAAHNNLKIDFDVYNRNVQNFKKTNPPKPHFRIICIDESSTIPSGDEIAAINKMCGDQVPVVLAIVGLGSVSFSQLKQSDIPTYIGNESY